MEFIGGDGMPQRTKIMLAVGGFFLLIALAIVLVLVFKKKEAPPTGGSSDSPSPPPPSPSQSPSAPPSPPPGPPAFSLQKPFLIRQDVDGTIKCLTDNGLTTQGNGRMGLTTCDAANVGQQFVYDPVLKAIYNINRPDPTFIGTRNPSSATGYLCVDDNATYQDAAGLNLHYWRCIGHPNMQWEFVKDTTPTGQEVYKIVNPVKNRCMDRGDKSWSCVNKDGQYYKNQIYTLANV
jgi:hypothetical protein